MLESFANPRVKILGILILKGSNIIGRGCNPWKWTVKNFSTLNGLNKNLLRKRITHHLNSIHKYIQDHSCLNQESIMSPG